MAYWLVLDIETAPIPNAAEYLPLGEIEADGRLKDPVKIAEDIAKKQAKLVSEAALDLDLARIVTIGMWTKQEGTQIAPLQNEAAETKGLEILASILRRPSRDGNDAMLITFYGSRYDLPLLMRRARYLGVKFPELNLDRYKSPHVDLHELLTLRGTVKAHPLRWYFRRLDYVDLLEADPLDKGGSDVGQAIAEGRWEDVAAHCRCDIEGTVRLARWLGILPAESEAF